MRITSRIGFLSDKSFLTNKKLSIKQNSTTLSNHTKFEWKDLTWFLILKS
jgi:hypothetical protein